MLSWILSSTRPTKNHSMSMSMTLPFAVRIEATTKTLWDATSAAFNIIYFSLFIGDTSFRREKFPPLRTMALVLEHLDTLVKSLLWLLIHIFKYIYWKKKKALKKNIFTWKRIEIAYGKAEVHRSLFLNGHRIEIIFSMNRELSRMREKKKKSCSAFMEIIFFSHSSCSLGNFDNLVSSSKFRREIDLRANESERVLFIYFFPSCDGVRITMTFHGVLQNFLGKKIRIYFVLIYTFCGPAWKRFENTQHDELEIKKSVHHQSLRKSIYITYVYLNLDFPKKIKASLSLRNWNVWFGRCCASENLSIKVFPRLTKCPKKSCEIWAQPEEIHQHDAYSGTLAFSHEHLVFWGCMRSIDESTYKTYVVRGVRRTKKICLAIQLFLWKMGYAAMAYTQTKQFALKMMKQ